MLTSTVFLESSLKCDFQKVVLIIFEYSETFSKQSDFKKHIFEA